MKYYLLENNEKVGPFSLDDLIEKGLNDKSLIWFKGLDNWTEARFIPDLKAVIEETPPPPPPRPPLENENIEDKPFDNPANAVVKDKLTQGWYEGLGMIALSIVLIVMDLTSTEDSNFYRWFAAGSIIILAHIFKMVKYYFNEVLRITEVDHNLNGLYLTYSFFAALTLFTGNESRIETIIEKSPVAGLFFVFVYFALIITIVVQSLILYNKLLSHQGIGVKNFGRYLIFSMVTLFISIVYYLIAPEGSNWLIETISLLPDLLLIAALYEMKESRPIEI